MIVILKRDDLPQKLRDWAVESLRLDHFELPVELVEQADMIVFVERSDVKFLLADARSHDLRSFLFSLNPYQGV